MDHSKYPPVMQDSPAAPMEPSNHKYEKYEAQRELAKAVGGAQEILASATTVFPFTLFPDTVTVDRTKLTLAHRAFFGIAEVVSIRVEDILNVMANVGPFFGSLQVSTRYFDSNTHKPYTVNWLWRKDAQRIKRILQGYIVAKKEKVDCSALSAKELATMLDRLGSGAPAE